MYSGRLFFLFWKVGRRVFVANGRLFPLVFCVGHFRPSKVPVKILQSKWWVPHHCLVRVSRVRKMTRGVSHLVFLWPRLLEKRRRRDITVVQIMDTFAVPLLWKMPCPISRWNGRATECCVIKNPWVGFVGFLCWSSKTAPARIGEACRMVKTPAGIPVF